MSCFVREDLEAIFMSSLVLVGLEAVFMSLFVTGY
jgi:hypothetical protein